ncbi:MAG: hypothetical protein IJ811_01640 [Clostridia bacterium]|nr:hypothetical protein [Clostridia bacterium]
MTIKDILELTCVYCGKEDLAKRLKQDKIPFENDEVQKLVGCYDLVTRELSEEVLPVYATEILTSPDGVYYFSQFSSVPKQIVKVTRDGKAVKFSVSFDRVTTDSDRVEITYDRLIKKANDFSDVCEYTDTDVSERMLALGVASEYMLISGLFDQAESYRRRYERAVESVLLKRNKVLKARRWA